MKVSIIIVSYNTAELLRDCLASLQEKVVGVDYEVIVVDNNSSDESVALVRRHFPSITVVCNCQNAGFARANNQGYALSRGDYILLLNSDTLIQAKAIERLVGFMDRHLDVAIVGPKLLNSDGSLQAQCRRRFPKLINSLAYVSGLSRLFPKSRMLNSYIMEDVDPLRDHEVEAVSGACMLVRRKVVDEVGGLLDEAYFMHFEDIDLCFRCHTRKYGIWYLHDAEVVHLKGQSSKFRRHGVRKDFFDSALIYLAKNYRAESWIGYIIFSMGVKCVRKIVA